MCEMDDACSLWSTIYERKAQNNNTFSKVMNVLSLFIYSFDYDYDLVLIVHFLSLSLSFFSLIRNSHIENKMLEKEKRRGDTLSKREKWYEHDICNYEQRE